MKTKELVDWLNEVIKYYEKDTIPWKRIKEIIRRLEELDELKRFISKPEYLQYYGTSAKYTVTTLIADDAIPERAIKQGLPLLFQKGGEAPFS